MVDSRKNGPGNQKLRNAELYGLAKDMSLKGYDGYFLGTNCILPFSLLEGKNRGCSKFTFLTKIQLVQATKNYATEIWHRCQKWWEKVSGFKHGYSGVSMLNFGGG